MKIIEWLRSHYILIIILTVAACIRLYHLDYQSVWLDEIHTLNESNPDLSLSQLYDTIMGADPHPPLYFILVHYIFQIFGYETLVLRLFSAVMGVIGIAATYLLGRELFNKRVGIYASVILTVNYFHLLYSQEGRMYSLLFLTTTLSFYYLVRFIKVPTIKSAVFYGLVSAAMIYCHFFALFTLFSQYLILLFFVIRPNHTTGKKLFNLSLISGFLSLILYLPVYNIFAKAAERTTIWIPIPTSDVYTQIFKDFFGQSELVIVAMLLLIGSFLIQLSKENDTTKFRIEPNENKLVFSSLILFTWITITLLLPLIRSYTTLPMLINRYFINILPAIILIVSAGLFYIENKIIRYGALCFIVIFSLTDVVIVKQYFTKIEKEQFREVSKFVIDNNPNNDRVVTNLGWYFPYFFRNESSKPLIIYTPLENFVDEISQDSTEILSFWHVEIGNHELDVSEASKKYLNDKFVQESSVKVHRGKAIHYVPISNSLSEMNISTFQPIKDRNGDDFVYYVDNFEVNSQILKISGFAYFNNQDATDSEITIVLLQNEKVFKVPSQTEQRDDVTEYFKSTFSLSNSGFNAKLLVGQLSPGKYQLGIILKNKKTNKEGMVICANTFSR